MHCLRCICVFKCMQIIRHPHKAYTLVSYVYTYIHIYIYIYIYIYHYPCLLYTNHQRHKDALSKLHTSPIPNSTSTATCKIIRLKAKICTDFDGFWRILVPFYYLHRTAKTLCSSLIYFASCSKSTSKKATSRVGFLYSLVVQDYLWNKAHYSFIRFLQSHRYIILNKQICMHIHWHTPHQVSTCDSTHTCEALVCITLWANLRDSNLLIW